MPDPFDIWNNQDGLGEVAYVLQSQRPRWLNFYGGFVVGPGVGSVVAIDGRPWLVFHGYKPHEPDRNPERRFVFHVPVEIDFRSREPNPSWFHVKLSQPGGPMKRKRGQSKS